MNRLFQALCVIVLAVSGLFASPATQATEQDVVANWIQENSHKKANMTPAKAMAITKAAYEQGRHFNIDPLLLIAKIHTESGFREKVVNRYKASGLMQVVPKYHPEKIQKRNILNMRVNIEVGTWIFDDYMKENKDNFRKALYKYTGGASPKHSKKMQVVHRELVERILMWKMENDRPIRTIAVYSNPRSFFDSTANAVPPPTPVPADVYAGKQEHLDRLMASL